MKVAKAQFTGKNWKTNEYTRGDLDTREQRDHKLIKEYLNEATEEYGDKRRGIKSESRDLLK